MADTTQQNSTNTQQGQQNTQQNGQIGDQQNMQQQQLQQNMQPDAKPYELTDADHDLAISFDEPEKKDESANDPLSFSDEDWTLDETFDPEDSVSAAENIPHDLVVQEGQNMQNSSEDIQPSQPAFIQTVTTEPTATVASESLVVQNNDSKESTQKSVQGSTPLASVSLNNETTATQQDLTFSQASGPSITEDIVENVVMPSASQSPKVGFNQRQPQKDEMTTNKIIENDSNIIPKKEELPDEIVVREQIESEPEKKVLSSLEDMLARISVLMSDIHVLNNNDDIRITGHKTDTEHLEYMFTYDTALSVTKIMHHDSTQHILRFEKEASLRVTLDSEEVYHSEKESLHEQVEMYLKDKLTKFIMLLEGFLSDIEKKKQQEAAQQKKQNMVAGLRNF